MIGSATTGWIEYEKIVDSESYRYVTNDFSSMPRQAIDRHSGPIHLYEQAAYDQSDHLIHLYEDKGLYETYRDRLNITGFVCSSADGFFDNVPYGTYVYYLHEPFEHLQNQPIIQFHYNQCAMVKKSTTYKAGTTPIAFHLSGSYTDEWYKKVPIIQ